MTTYGYVRTSRDQESGHPGSAPQVQRRQLFDASVDDAHIYDDVTVSVAVGYNGRDQWHVLDQQLALGDVLVMAAIDRLGQRYLPAELISEMVSPLNEEWTLAATAKIEYWLGRLTGRPRNNPRHQAGTGIGSVCR